MVTRQIIATLILFYLLSGKLVAQSIIEGVVVDELGKPVDGCVVFLINKSTLLLANNTLTNEQGQYRVVAPTVGEYLLEFRNLAYRDSIFNVQTDGQSPILINVALVAKIFDLRAVEVVDKMLGIRRSGDTIFYNIHAYTSGSETIVEELLRKLPGIEVSNTGQISFMGKTVDALLIDGNDLSGKQHSHITQNFLSDIVDRVQIIENYIGEFDAISQTGDIEKVAMNIELNKDKKATTIGQMTGGGGYNGRYLTKINALRSAPKQGFSLFAGSSNHERFPQTEELVSTYPEGRNYTIGTKAFGFIDYSVYSNQFPEGKFNEHFIQMTETNRMNPLWSRRTFIELADRKSESVTQINKLRFADQSTESSLQSLTKNRFSARFDHDTKLQVSPKWRIIGKVNAVLVIPGQTLVDTGHVAVSTYFLEADAKKLILQLNMEGLAEYSIHKRHTIKLSASYGYLEAGSDWAIFADAPLLGHSVPDNSGKHSIQYQDQYQQKHISFGAEWTWTPDIAEFAFFGRKSNLKEDLQLQFINNSIPENADFITPVYEVGFKTTFKINNLKIGGDITMLRSGNDEKENFIQHNLLPSLQLSHDLGKLSLISINVKRQVLAPGLLYLHGLPVIFDQKTLIPYGLLPHQHISSWYGAISLKKKPGSHKDVFIANLSATWSDQNLVFSEYVEQNYILRSTGLSPSNSIYRLMLFGWHTVDKWKLNFNHFSVYTTGFSILDNSYAKQENLWSRTMLGFMFNGFNSYELSISPEIQFQQQNIGGIVTYWINPLLNLTARFKGLNWEYSLDITQNISRTNSQNLDVQIVNASIGYRKWMPFRIYLEGTNLLNLVSNSSLTAAINPAFSQSIISERLPGSILLIGRYDF